MEFIYGMNIIYNFSVILILSLAGVVFLLLFYISAPYGKFRRKGWGPSVRSKWAWMIMESPSPVLMACFFLTSDQKNLPQHYFYLLWLSHYIHRTFIYPFTQSGSNKSYPVIFWFSWHSSLIVSMALSTVMVCFILMSYDFSWLLSWQFISGVADFPYRICY